MGADFKCAQCTSSSPHTSRRDIFLTTLESLANLIKTTIRKYRLYPFQTALSCGDGGHDEGEPMEVVIEDHRGVHVKFSVLADRPIEIFRHLRLCDVQRVLSRHPALRPILPAFAHQPCRPPSHRRLRSSKRKRSNTTRPSLGSVDFLGQTVSSHHDWHQPMPTSCPCPEIITKQFKAPFDGCSVNVVK